MSSTSAVPEESDPKPLRAPAKPEAPEAWRGDSPWKTHGKWMDLYWGSAGFLQGANIVEIERLYLSHLQSTS